MHNWKSDCLCCLLTYPFNISCLELNFPFFLPDFHFSHFSGLDPLFTRFLFIFDVGKILCNLSQTFFSAFLICLAVTIEKTSAFAFSR